MRRPRTPTWRRAGALSALLCAIAPVRAAEGAPTDWRASYRVRLGLMEADVPVAEVEATLKCERKGACPASVEVDMAEDGFPGGYGSFVRGFQALLPEGSQDSEPPHAAETVSVPEGRYRLPVGRDGSASFRYRIVLDGQGPLHHGPAIPRGSPACGIPSWSSDTTVRSS